MHSNYSELIPDHFTAKQKFFGFGMDMKIKADGHTIGRINQKSLSLGKSFEFFDKNDKIVCTAKQKLFSLGIHLQIYDADGNNIGNIDRLRLKSLLSFKDKFSIKDAYGNIIGQSQELQLLRTNIQIFDQHHNKIGSMKKQFLHIRDTWDCHIYGNIDRRLLIFIPAFASARQEDKQIID